MLEILIAAGTGGVAGAATQYLKMSGQTRRCWKSWVPALRRRPQVLAAIAGLIGALVGATAHAIANAVEDSISTTATVPTAVAVAILAVLFLNNPPDAFVGKTAAAPINVLNGRLQWLKLDADSQLEEAATIAVIALDIGPVTKLASRLHRIAIGGEKYETQESMMHAHNELLRLGGMAQSTDPAEANEAFGQLQAFAIQRILRHHETKPACGL